MKTLSLGNSRVQIGKDLWADVRPGGSDQVILHYMDLEAHVRKDGDFWIVFDSKAMAMDYMKKSEHWTEVIQKHFREYERRTRPGKGNSGYIENWVTVHPYRTWGEPDVYPSGRVGWKTGVYGSGNSFNFGEDCWLGDVFEYTHLVTPHDEGAVIRWHLGGDVRVNYSEPEVWIGGFEEFMGTQQDCDWFSDEGFLNWNANFQGGIIWAIDQLGGFDGVEEPNIKVYRAIMIDPTIVKGPVATKILENERLFPPEVVRAARMVV